MSIGHALHEYAMFSELTRTIATMWWSSYSRVIILWIGCYRGSYEGDCSNEQVYGGAFGVSEQRAITHERKELVIMEGSSMHMKQCHVHYHKS